MAACLITLAGTSGEITIRYTQDSVVNTINTEYGVAPIYIDDSATDVTYTTVSGDVTASSGCLTVTELPIEYWTITYDRLKKNYTTYDARFDAVLIDTTVKALSPTITDKFTGYQALIAAVDTTLDDYTIKIVGYKIDAAGGSTNYYNISLLFRVIGGGTPWLRINSNYNNKSYLKGITSVAEPDGYTIFEIPIEIPS